MAKLLLILVLVTTQLAAAGSRSVYLCFDGDGEYCCLDAGPDSCNCCRDEQESPHDACCEACEQEHSGSPSRHHDDNRRQACDGFLSAADSCGCTHIAVVMSSDRSIAIRSPVSSDAETSLSLVALPPMLSCIGDAMARPLLRWADPPAVPDFAQTVLSTVVIRC
ncbi:MAG: hypothetical protein U0992_24810 [Planctomycetaceae bacterium]